METIAGVGVLIMIFIGMLFGRIMQVVGLIIEILAKLFKKIF